LACVKRWQIAAANGNVQLLSAAIAADVTKTSRHPNCSACVATSGYWRLEHRHGLKKVRNENLRIIILLVTN